MCALQFVAHVENHETGKKMPKARVRNQTRNGKSHSPPAEKSKLNSLAPGDFHIAHDFDPGDALPTSYLNTLSVEMHKTGDVIEVRKLQATITPFAANQSAQK